MVFVFFMRLSFGFYGLYCLTIALRKIANNCDKPKKRVRGSSFPPQTSYKLLHFLCTIAVQLKLARSK